MLSPGELIGKRLFQVRVISGLLIKYPSQGHIMKKFRRSTVLYLTIKSLTASQMTVLQHLAEELEALVILLHGTHCTTTEKLVIAYFKLTGSTLRRKLGIATFVFERLNSTLCSQSLPISDTEWLCVDVDRYKIINIYEPPPKRLQTFDLLVFPHPNLCAVGFNSLNSDWGNNKNSADGE